MLAGGPARAFERAVELAGHPRVKDGDSLVFGKAEVRLEGIDAPEWGQRCRAEGRSYPCGKEAAQLLQHLIAGVIVRCRGTEFDRYDRLIATCLANGRDINREMVLRGQALAFRRYSTSYVAEEARARAQGAGLWSSVFVAPWEYRARRWQQAAATAPRPGCPIKGNINRRGERIYHTPYSRSYARTRIDPARGERWFCSEAEALRLGWRAPRR
ncbi:MAG: thermonuclease family protein [Alphaproteobacteria bacterium]|nr:MAG: thermonuclease family protein [Alphaproteobacteria bacterium]